MQTLRVLLADVTRALIEHDIDPWLEFHGYEIFQGEGEWKFLKKLQRKRVLVYRLVLQAIVDSGCTIWISGVETVGLKNKYGERAFHPHEVALHNLLDTIDSRHQPTMRRCRYLQIMSRKKLCVKQEWRHSKPMERWAPETYPSEG